MRPRPFQMRAFGPAAAIGAALALLFAILAPTLTARAASPAFVETFTGAIVVEPTDWTASKGTGGTGFNNVQHDGEFPCLTALAPTEEIELDEGSLVGCPNDRTQSDTDPIDAIDEGVLRLTDDRFLQSGMVLYNRPQSVADGLDITFRFAIYGGTTCPSGPCGTAVTGADGFSFFLKDGDNEDDSAGMGGGALGYGLSFTTSSGAYGGPGIRGGLLGIGFDFYGAFSSDGVGAGNGVPARACANESLTLAATGPRVFDHVVLRGPDASAAGDGSCGYEYLGRSADPVDLGRAAADGSAAPGDGTRPPAATRDLAARNARVVIDKPSEGARVRVFVWQGSEQPEVPVLDLPQPAALEDVDEFKFGFSAGTGWATNIHEIWDLRIILADPEVQAAQAAEQEANDAEVGAGTDDGPEVEDEPQVTDQTDGEAELPADPEVTDEHVGPPATQTDPTEASVGGPIPTQIDAGGGRASTWRLALMTATASLLALTLASLRVSPAERRLAL